MQKEDVMSLIAYLLMIGFAFAMGFGFVQPAIANGIFGRTGDKGAMFLFLFLSVVIGIILIALLTELAHVIGAKLGKYEILSVNIFGFCTYKTKEDDKIKNSFKFPRNFDGLTGETVIRPTSEKSKPIFYIFAPLFLFLLEVLTTVLLFLFFEDSTESADLMMMYVKYGSFIVTTIGGMVMIYNYFPSKLDNSNDGFKLISLNKKSNIEAYNEYLRVNACVYFDENPGEIKKFDEINDFTAKVNMLSVNSLIESNYKEALADIDTIVEDPSKITKSTFNNIMLTKAYILFMNEDLETAKNFYVTELNEEQRKMCVSCVTPIAIRVYLLYESLVEKSESEVEIAKSKIKKAVNKVPVAEQPRERELLEEVINKIENK